MFGLTAHWSRLYPPLDEILVAGQLQERTAPPARGAAQLSNLVQPHRTIVVGCGIEIALEQEVERAVIKARTTRPYIESAPGVFITIDCRDLIEVPLREA